MNQIAVVHPSKAAACAVTSRCPQPTSVKVLLPVWGYRFVRQFLDFTLPTLLAPGNMPALAAALPCQFVVLTAAADEDVIREHHAWKALKGICSVEIQSIDDLITDGNHSTTITLAYARAVRQSGAQMVDTCFIFLVSDYLVADGSLAHVLERMQTGVSAVLAGNFQIIAEEAIPLLSRKLTAASLALVVPPRELLRWTLNHLHPATTANIVNYRLNHNAHTNRLFWRVDESTLIGRFYLMHPIAIRPEVAEFIIGSSFDYSFIPEMCPPTTSKRSSTRTTIWSWKCSRASMSCCTCGGGRSIRGRWRRALPSGPRPRTGRTYDIRWSIMPRTGQPSSRPPSRRRTLSSIP